MIMKRCSASCLPIRLSVNRSATGTQNRHYLGGRRLSFPNTSDSRESAAVQETQVWSLDEEDYLTKEMTTDSNILCEELNMAERLTPLTLNKGQKTIPGSGRSLEEGTGNLLQYSCLEISMDRGAWWATVHRVTKKVRHEWATKRQQGVGRLCFTVWLCGELG